MRSFEQIVNSQVARWAANTRGLEERRSQHDTIVATPVLPSITVGRDFGSGGAAIGRMLADRLGYDFFDNELLDAIAEESRYRRKFLESVDEKVRSATEAHIDALIHGKSFVHSDVLRYLMKVVMTIGRHGRAVVLGRGAGYILSSETNLSVRIVAPFEHRANEVAVRDAVSLNEAEQRVRDVDRARADFRKCYYHRDAWRADDYDLVLNSSRMSVEDAVGLIETVLFTRFSKQSPA